VGSVPLGPVEEIRSVMRVNVQNEQIAKLLEDTMVWTESGVHIGADADVVVTASLLSELAAANATMTTMIGDLDGLIASQMQNFADRANEEDYNKNYHSIEEITARLQFFANNFENVDFIASVGSTIENRNVPALRFGAVGTPSNPVPTVWLECGIHAREWITSATCLYFTQKLFEGSKSEYKDLFDGLQFYLVPSVNPDGLTFSQKTNRLWRKNRRQNADGSYGVDLNRNFGDHWNKGGSSTVPSSDTYMGTAPFSEPESANIVAFLNKIESEGAVIEAGIDFHSYSQLLLRPYGWTTPEKSQPPNENRVQTLTADMRDAIKAVHGTVFTSEHAAELYIASGIASDWLATRSKQGLGLTYELRDTGRYGFLLPASQIIPSGEEILPSVVLFSRSVLNEVKTRA